MAESNLDWLRDHMRDHIANTTVDGSTDNVVPFEHPSLPANKPDAAAIDLVHQAAELIQVANNKAVESQAHAEALATQAIEKLKIARDRVQFAESALRTAEAEKNEFSAKVQALEEALEQMRCRTAATEVQLSIALQRADAAELRVVEAENVLKYIEDALQRVIIEKGLINLGSQSVRAA
jgi:hypothetical protein